MSRAAASWSKPISPTRCAAASSAAPPWTSISIEPLPADSELLKLDNIVVTPHLAAATADTFEPTVRRMFDNMARVARGEPVPAKDLVV